MSGFICDHPIVCCPSNNDGRAARWFSASPKQSNDHSDWASGTDRRLACEGCGVISRWKNSRRYLRRIGLLLYSADGALINHLALAAGPLGLAWTPNSRTLFASGDKGQVYHVAETEQNKWGAITSFVVDNLSRKPQADETPAPGQMETELRPDPNSKYLLKRFAKASQFTGDPQVTGLAVSPDGKRLYIALSKRNVVTVVDIASETVIATVPVGVAPFRVVVSPDSKTVFVANRGGRHPRKGQTVASSAGTELRVDPATDAALRGSISFIDAKTFATAEMDEGRQPTGMVVTHDGKTLYVANSDEDTVTTVDVGTHRVLQSLSLQPEQDPGLGQLPTDLALAGDGKTLYVTSGGGNAVAIISLPDFALTGFLPTAWFPIAIAERNGKLFVGSSKGIGSRSRSPKAEFPIAGRSYHCSRRLLPCEWQRQHCAVHRGKGSSRSGSINEASRGEQSLEHA